MFPEDRLSSFLPNVQNLHEDLSQDIKLFHTPKTSAELGSHLVLNQFLPAWDIQAYVRFAGINLHTMNSRYPATMSTGEFPQLNDGNFLVPRAHIVTHLQTFHHDIDENLSSMQKADLYAFRGIVQDRLENAMDYNRWLDKPTYQEVTLPLMKKCIPFPANQFLPKRMHDNVSSRLSKVGLRTREQVYTILRDSYIALESKLSLSDGPYFFGDTPSSLDAFVFGHVVEAMQNNNVAEVLYHHAPTLVSHANTVRDSFFLNTSKKYSEDQANMFLDHQSHFIPRTTTIDSIKPYRSLSWAKRDIHKIAMEKQSKESEESSITETKFAHGSRNTVLGGLLGLVVYALFTFPLQVNFQNDVDELEMDESFEE